MWHYTIKDLRRQVAIHPDVSKIVPRWFQVKFLKQCIILSQHGTSLQPRFHPKSSPSPLSRQMIASYKCHYNISVLLILQILYLLDMIDQSPWHNSRGNRMMFKDETLWGTQYIPISQAPAKSYLQHTDNARIQWVCVLIPHSCHTLQCQHKERVQHAHSYRTTAACHMWHMYTPHNCKILHKMHYCRAAYTLPVPTTCWASTGLEVASHPATLSCRHQKSRKIVQGVRLEKRAPVVREALHTWT